MVWLSESASPSTQPFRSTVLADTLCSSTHSPVASGAAVGFCITSVITTSPAPGVTTPPTQAPASQVAPVAEQSTSSAVHSQFARAPSAVQVPGISQVASSASPLHSLAGA